MKNKILLIVAIVAMEFFCQNTPSRGQQSAFRPLDLTPIRLRVQNGVALTR